MNYLDRYNSGENVWQELILLGEEVRNEPLMSEAVEIGSIIIDRMYNNIVDLVNKLSELQYRFGWYDADTPIRFYKAPLTEPPAGRQIVLNQLQEIAGPLPILINLWYEKFGSVDFRGFHQDWDIDFLDPIVTVGLSLDHIASEYAEWENEESEDKFQLSISPDYLHKANVSGGLPYNIEIPDKSIDGKVLNEENCLYFYNYLQLCLKWGGFPGLALKPSGIPESHLEMLKKDLINI